MAYCTNCGAEIQAGEIHVCPLEPKEAGTPQPISSGVSLEKNSSGTPQASPEPTSPSIPAQPDIPSAAQASSTVPGSVPPPSNVPVPVPPPSREESADQARHNEQAGQPGQPGAASATASRLADAAKSEWSKLDTGKLLGLLKNPLSALHLRGDRDLLLGIFGLLSPLLGFLIWAWAFKRNLINGLTDGFTDTGFFDGDLDSLSGSLNDRIIIVGPMFMASLISVLVLLAAAYLLGNWRGQDKQSLREGWIRLSGVQFFAGALFLVSAVLVFMSTSASLLLVGATLLLAFVLTQYAAIRMFRIAEERVSLFLALTVAIQTVAIALILNGFSTQLAEGFQDLLRGF
ncbi:hypothetical protein [Saccharibacillus sacchari]|uniref:Uncharacterized protein n=1 Tax=Saccharibacillus sacchari TaxID=456493 RepID=A0ACC6P9C4_9BACL